MGEINAAIGEKKDWKSHGPPAFTEDERRHIFQYPRPPMRHIEYIKIFDPVEINEHIDNCSMTDEGWHKYVKSEISTDDAEGDPTDYRISPCTFVLLAKGARRWDDLRDHFRGPANEKTAKEPQKTHNVPVSKDRDMKR